MASEDASRTRHAERSDGWNRWIPTLALFVGSGLLVGLGTLALARGVHLYVHFYSYATGIPTSRLTQTILWSVAGGMLLVTGLALVWKGQFPEPSS